MRDCSLTGGPFMIFIPVMIFFLTFRSISLTMI